MALLFGRYWIQRLPAAIYECAVPASGGPLHEQRATGALWMLIIAMNIIAMNIATLLMLSSL
jgi:hypothetical protein